MSNVILVRNVSDKSELYVHEISQGEKPWEVLQSLMQMDFDGRPAHEIEYVMDPNRQDRELIEVENNLEAMNNAAQP